MPYEFVIGTLDPGQIRKEEGRGRGQESIAGRQSGRRAKDSPIKMKANSKVKGKTITLPPPHEKSLEEDFFDPRSPLFCKGKRGQGEGAIRDPSPVRGVRKEPPQGNNHRPRQCQVHHLRWYEEGSGRDKVGGRATRPDPY